MKDKLEEIKKRSGKDIKTRYIVADLFKLYSIEDYQRVIGDKLKDIDVAMLFLNAGWLLMGPFMDLTNDEIEQTINVHILHPVYLSKVMLNQLLSRKKRSAIVFVGSGFGIRPSAGVVMYSAAKGLV